MNAAREADRNGEIPRAIELYETLVKDEEAELIDFLNLIVIYFYCMDLGYASASSVGSDTETIASTRALELISLAEEKFGLNDELLYWKYIIPYHGWSESIPEWHLNGDSHVPYLYLARERPNEERLQHVRELAMQLPDLDESERKHYLEGKVALILGDAK